MGTITSKHKGKRTYLYGTYNSYGRAMKTATYYKRKLKANYQIIKKQDMKGAWYELWLDKVIKVY